MKHLGLDRTLRMAEMAEELAGVGYWRMDAATREIVWSANMYRIHGIDPNSTPELASAIGRVHPDDRDAAAERLAAMLAGAPGESRTRVVRPNGDVCHVVGRSACEFGPDGEVVALFGTVVDITEEIESQNRLRRSEARYRLLAENSRDIIVCCNAAALITFVSPSVSTILGFAPEEMIGKSTHDFMHPDDRERVRNAVRDFVNLGNAASPVRIEYRLFDGNGREIWVEAHPRCVFAPNGELIEIQDSLREITARKILEKEMLEAKAAAEESARVKSEFLANVTHELRTPLTAIIGYSGLLHERDDLPQEAVREAGLVGVAGRALLAVVNGILDYSRIEAGRIPINLAAVSPRFIAQECIDLMIFNSVEKSLSLDYVERGRLPEFIDIDADAYRQVVLNLLGNAVKFTDRGGVVLELRYDATSHRLSTSVTDTGPGFSDGSGLFERFSQLDSSTSRQHGGVGLGLAICKGLVEAMGGAIQAHSEPGRGATFQFSLPAPESAPRHREAVVYPLTGASILVADDSEAVRDIARKLLQGHGAMVAEAEDGATALDAARAKAYDVILMDIRMPGMDGLEAVRKIRSQPGPNRNAPIVAFTADGESHSSGAYRDFGFDGVLWKPIDPETLVALVARFATAASPVN